MWKLEKEADNKRIWVNSETNSRCEQTMCYKDKDGNHWWEFDILSAIPFIRNMAAVQIANMYGVGLTIEDKNNFFAKHKATLKMIDNGEKYEMAYAETLDFERKINIVTDAVKQMIMLVPVYFTFNNELIDSFENGLQLKKMSILEVDPEMHSFFLQKQIIRTEHYMNHLKKISPIALQAVQGL